MSPTTDPAVRLAILEAIKTPGGRVALQFLCMEAPELWAANLATLSEEEKAQVHATITRVLTSPK